MAYTSKSEKYISTQYVRLAGLCFDMPVLFQQIYRNRNPDSNMLIGVPRTADNNPDLPTVRLHDKRFIQTYGFPITQIPAIRAEELEIKDGKIKLPKHFKKHAKLTDRVCLIGVNEIMEIWEPNIWEAFHSRPEKSPGWINKIMRECAIEYMQEWNCRVEK